MPEMVEETGHGFVGFADVATAHAIAVSVAVTECDAVNGEIAHNSVAVATAHAAAELVVKERDVVAESAGAGVVAAGGMERLILVDVKAVAVGERWVWRLIAVSEAEYVVGQRVVEMVRMIASASVRARVLRPVGDAEDRSEGASSNSRAPCTGKGGQAGPRRVDYKRHECTVAAVAATACGNCSRDASAVAVDVDVAEVALAAAHTEASTAFGGWAAAAESAHWFGTAGFPCMT